MKAKFRISQLAATPKDIELIHPVVGETGIVMQVAGPHSKQFQNAYDVFSTSAQLSDDNLKLFCSCIIGWDEEAMEMPFSLENAEKFFADPTNAWVSNQLAPVMKEYKQFFRIEGGQTSGRLEEPNSIKQEN